MGLIIMIAAIIGTTHMVILSYLFPDPFRTFYKEPLFLKYILQKFRKTLSANSEALLNYFITYLMGLLFVLCFDLLLQYGILNLSGLTGLIFGSIAGVFMLGWWHLMFKISYSVDLDFKRYYRPLFLSYIIFGLTVTGVYKIGIAYYLSIL